MSILWDFVKDITYGKKNLTKDNPDILKDYNPFMINKALSMGADTILYANEMNKRPGMDKQMQHDYLFHSIRARKRYNPWAKSKKVDYVDAISEYYNISKQKATELTGVLQPHQLESIRARVSKGGKKR